MKRDEEIVFKYLKNIYKDVIYEPDGNIPPDFSINSVFAVEARRLNEQYITSNKSEGMEEFTYTIHEVFNSVLRSFDQQYMGKTYLVGMNYEHPVIEDFKKIKKQSKDSLQEFLNLNSSNFPYNLIINPEIDFDIYNEQPVEGRVFIPAGYFDESAFVPALVNIYIESVRYCISEKSSKINQYLSRYKEWWLVLLDYLGEGLNEIEKGEVLSKISTLGNFDKVFVISADGKRHLISILKY